MALAKEPSKCIWCTELRQGTLEHIIPESLGCPKWFVLPDGICQSCNNRNGTLDNALLKPFELLTVMTGTVRKGGRSPTVASHSSFASRTENGRPELFFNREKFSVNPPMNRNLGPTSKNDPIEEFTVKEFENGKVQFALKHRMDFTREAVRALFKIALQTIAYVAGPDIALDDKFDPIRNFVLNDLGNYKALHGLGHAETAIKIVGDGTELVSFSILGYWFICDFDPEFRNGRNLDAIGRLQNKQLIVLPHR